MRVIGENAPVHCYTELYQNRIKLYSSMKYLYRSQLTRIGGTLNNHRHIKKICSQNSYLFGQRHLRVVISARQCPTTCNVNFVQNLLITHQISLFPWPAHSLDMSPIANVWDCIGRLTTRIAHSPQSTYKFWLLKEAVLN